MFIPPPPLPMKPILLLLPPEIPLRLTFTLTLPSPMSMSWSSWSIMAISAQTQGVPSEQNPHGSAMRHDVALAVDAGVETVEDAAAAVPRA